MSLELRVYLNDDEVATVGSPNKIYFPKFEYKKIDKLNPYVTSSDDTLEDTLNVFETLEEVDLSLYNIHPKNNIDIIKIDIDTDKYNNSVLNSFIDKSANILKVFDFDNPHHELLYIKFIKINELYWNEYVTLLVITEEFKSYIS